MNDYDDWPEEPDNERMAREAEQYQKQKIMDYLISEHGLNKVEPSDCLPKKIKYGGDGVKLGEYRMKFFISRKDDDYESPDTEIACSYSALYYMRDTDKYTIMRKDKGVCLGEHSPEMYEKKIRKLGAFEFGYFDRTISHSINYCSSDIHVYLRDIYDVHVHDMQIKKEKKAARVAIKKEREKKKHLRIMKKIADKNDKSDCAGNWSGMVL